MSIKKHIFFVLFGALFPLHFFCYAQSSLLELTEVYFDGTDERVEVTNVSGTPFVGEISLSGAKSSLLLVSVSLKPGESAVIGDDGKMLLSGYIFIGNNGLQLADTSQIKLWLSGPGVDSFFQASSGLVNELNNKQTSLCKNSLQIIAACQEQEIYGVVSGVIANPGMVGEGRFIDAGESIGAITENDVLLGSGEDTILTGDGIDGESITDTGYVGGVPLCVSVEASTAQPIYYPSPLLISEIYPFSKYSGSYIEVYARGSYSGVVQFTGAGAGQKSLRTHIDVDTGVYIVFSAEGWGDYLLTGLSLRDDGEIIGLVDDESHVMDRVVYYSGSSTIAHYFSLYSGDLRVFSAKGAISPKYEISMPSSETILPPLYGGCWIDLQRSSTYEYGSSLNLNAVLQDQLGTNLNTSSYRCLREYGDGRQEQGSCNPGWFTYSGEGLYTVSLTIFDNNSRVCQTKQFVNYVRVTPPKTHSGSSNSTASCPVITPPKSIQSLVQQAIGNTTGVVSGSLVGVLPNPVGKDEENERVFVRIVGNMVVPNLLGLRLKTSKKQHTLKGGISLGSGVYVFDGGFGLRNGSGCLELFQGGRLLDDWCYLSEGEGTITWRDGVDIVSNYTGNTGNTSPLSFGEGSIRNPLTTPKALSAPTKSAIPKTKNASTRATTSKQVTKKTSTSSDAKDKKIQQLSKEITSSERIVQLQKNYIHLLSNEMASVSYVFTGNKLQLFDKAYRSLLNFAKQQPSLQIQNTTVSVTDIRTYLGLVHNILPIEADLSIPYGMVRRDTLRQYGYMWSVLYRG